jgi:hypothetical protein
MEYVIQFWDKLKLGWADMVVLEGINDDIQARSAFLHKKSMVGCERIRLVRRRGFSTFLL